MCCRASQDHRYDPLTRDLSDYRDKGVDVRAADFSRPEGLVDAFRGADIMLLISTEAVGARLGQHAAAFEEIARMASDILSQLFTRRI